MSSSSWARIPSDLAKMQLAARVLALAGAPARVVHGIILKEQKERLPLVHWLEIYNTEVVGGPRSRHRRPGHPR